MMHGNNTIPRANINRTRLALKSAIGKIRINIDATKVPPR